MTLLRRLFSTAFLLLAASAAVAGPVNINTADAQTLAAELTGIGLAKAQAIVEHRKRFGAFKSLEALMDVPGIGARTLEQNREMILLEDEQGPGRN